MALTIADRIASTAPNGYAAAAENTCAACARYVAQRERMKSRMAAGGELGAYCAEVNDHVLPDNTDAELGCTSFRRYAK